MLTIAIQIPAFPDNVRSDTYSLACAPAKVEQADEMELLAVAVEDYRTFLRVTRARALGDTRRRVQARSIASRKAYAEATGMPMPEVAAKLKEIVACFR